MNTSLSGQAARSRAEEAAREAATQGRLMAREADLAEPRRRRGPIAISADARAGVRAMLPMVIAYAPFGLVVGAAVAASANPLAAWLATWTIYSGAAHLAVLDVLGEGAGWLAAAAVGLLVNVRLTAYATSMAPRWRSAPRGQRALAGLLLSEAPWALAHGRVSGHRAYYLGAGLTLFVGWPTLVTVGVLAHRWLGTAPVLGLLVALTLGSVVAHQVRQRPVAAAVAAAAVATLVTAPLPAGATLLTAAGAGAVAGLVAEVRS